MKAYLLSGLGGDHRMFTHLRLPAGYIIEHIPWENPELNESISDYACRLFGNKDQTQPFIVIGISFGGFIAVEIAKRFNPLVTIIISSFPVSSQLPRIYTIAGKYRIHEFLPVTVLKWLTIVKQSILRRSNSDKELLMKLITDGDDRMIKWGLGAALGWTNQEIPKNLYHIHGVQDIVLPISRTRPTHSIRGGHMIVLSHAEKINSIIGKLLNCPLIQVSFG